MTAQCARRSGKSCPISRGRSDSKWHLVLSLRFVSGLFVLLFFLSSELFVAGVVEK